MKKFAVMIFALLMIFSATALAKNVTVTGTGLTATEAENVAVRQNELCKIKIVELNPDYAVCRLEGNTSVIHKGDIVKRS